MTVVTLGQITKTVKLWLRRRRCTIGLALFLSAWYGFQLFVASRVGVEVAKRWFYFTPNFGMGWITAPISHNMQDVGHLIRNISNLLLAGSFIEPHLKKYQYLSAFLGILTFSIFVSVIGAVLLVDEPWLVAGASGGVYGLWVLAAVYRFEVLRNWKRWISVDEWGDLRYWFECVMVFFGLALLIVVPVVDIYMGSSANTIAHISGMLFGAGLGFGLSK